MTQSTNRTCAWCGKPATAFTVRPAEALAYQEWCAEHAPAGAQPLPLEPERPIPHDQPIDLSQFDRPDSA